MGTLKERVKTEVSEPQMAQAMIEAWKLLFKTEPSKEQIAILIAQNALETGHRKSMYNFNIGNIKAQEKGPYDYYYLNAPEQTAPGVWKNLHMAFRAYPSLTEGVKDYIKLLSTSSRYASAWQHVMTPNPASFSKALKAGGYYTADEKAYTKLLTGIYGNFNKSKSYDKAREMQAAIPALKEDTSTVMNNMSPNVESILEGFLQEVRASERNNKKLYKKFLPSQNIVIAVNGPTYTDAIEFSRILCTALDEELMARAFIHTDNEIVEVDCTISGPAINCFEAVKQLTNSLAQAFKKATIKVGGIHISTSCIMDKKSSYQEITLHAAQNNYRRFLLKFV